MHQCTGDTWGSDYIDEHLNGLAKGYLDGIGYDLSVVVCYDALNAAVIIGIKYINNNVFEISV